MFIDHFQNIFSPNLSREVVDATRNDYYNVVPHKFYVVDHDKLDMDSTKDELFSSLSSM